jgi:hypothetical protein
MKSDWIERKPCKAGFCCTKHDADGESEGAIDSRFGDSILAIHHIFVYLWLRRVVE